MRDGSISVLEAAARLRAVGYRVETAGRELQVYLNDKYVDSVVTFKERVNPDAVRALQMKSRA
jgi:hypothetical protein